jgi:hypothetical protein
MNLEKFNDQQKGLNSLLAIHITDLENVMASLVSKSGPLQKRLETKEDIMPYAILDKLEQEQLKTGELIDRLNFLKQEFKNAVYDNDKDSPVKGS